MCCPVTVQRIKLQCYKIFFPYNLKPHYALQDPHAGLFGGFGFSYQYHKANTLLFLTRTIFVVVIHSNQLQMEHWKANFYTDVGSQAAPAFLSMVCAFNIVTSQLLLHHVLKFWKGSP